MSERPYRKNAIAQFLADVDKNVDWAGATREIRRVLEDLGDTIDMLEDRIEALEEEIDHASR
jgi:nitrogenase molybdenum-iron protein alpha/beta subunit